jgi:hypothetical protein
VQSNGRMWNRGMLLEAGVVFALWREGFLAGKKFLGEMFTQARLLTTDTSAVHRRRLKNALLRESKR